MTEFDYTALSGTWYANRELSISPELGGTLTLSTQMHDRFTGTYTFIGGSKSGIRFPINGQFDVPGVSGRNSAGARGKAISIGWTMTPSTQDRSTKFWFSDSKMIWRGEYLRGGDEEDDRILTRWKLLMLKSAAYVDEDSERLSSSRMRDVGEFSGGWECTVIGMTVYTRVNRGAGHKQRRFTSPPLVAKDHGIMRRLSFRTKFSGTWYNRIGSVMNLTGDVFGRLFGTYQSIGSAKDKEEGRKFTLSGHFDTSPPGKTNSSSENGTPMKWTIQWHQQYGAERATSTWSGVYFAGETGSGEEILTQWLLTRKGESDENDGWVSTSMGNEWFSRLRPSDDVVEKAREFGFVSAHPEPE